MDFSFSEEQIMLRDLAREILEKECTTEVVKQIEAEGGWFHEALWKGLADANLLGLAIPEEHGGMGFGFGEICILLEEIGRTTAPLPVLPSLVLGALPISHFGTPAQQEQWLPKVAAGEVVLTAALTDAGSADPIRPALTATPDGDGLRLSGRKLSVSAAGQAARILVPARIDDAVGIFLVSPSAEGLTATRQVLTHREGVFDLAFDGVAVSADDRLGGPDADGTAMLPWLQERALVATAAVQLGVSTRALEITRDYTKEREQFGAPIGALPAVQHRQADCYIQLEGMRWSLWRAAWRLSMELPALRETLVAKVNACDGGANVAVATQHLHGGLGVDLDYPIHRYFLWTKSLELSLGAATPQLVRLGRDMARTGPQELS